MDLATLEPTPADSQLPPRRPAYDSTLDHAPFETLEKYYPCPPACISRNLMTEDVEGTQVYTGIRDPLDPMVGKILHSCSHPHALSSISHFSKFPSSWATFESFILAQTHMLRESSPISLNFHHLEQHLSHAHWMSKRFTQRFVGWISARTAFFSPSLEVDFLWFKFKLSFNEVANLSFYCKIVHLVIYEQQLLVLHPMHDPAAQ